jgi:uncharacterized MAPEG superfamily protein
MYRSRVLLLPAVLIMTALLLSADRAAAQAAQEEVGLAPRDVEGSREGLPCRSAQAEAGGEREEPGARKDQ